MKNSSLNPNIVAAPYKKVIDAFKNRADVQNGWAIAYRPGQNPSATPSFENIPKGIGDGLTTTGWCVSASQALLFDKIFQILIKDRGAFAKLISIDIKEQYYGHCYSGNQNKWHTAILVEDSGINLVIDITCAQFGNQFVGKEIWDYETWEKTFRSPVCEHKIFANDGTELTFQPNTSRTTNNENVRTVVENRLYDITTITNGERKTLAEFFVDKFNMVNSKLLVGNINKHDYEYIDKLNKLFRELNFAKYNNQFCVLEFPNKDSAKLWLDKLIKNDFILQQYIITSRSIEESCLYNNYEFDMVNVETDDPNTYVILHFEDVQGVDVDFIRYGGLCVPYGIKLGIDPKTDIMNGGALLENDIPNIPKKTNTIYIKAKI